MANKEQLAILEQGVDVWNRWREDNPDVEIDLSEANLTNANLKGANLNGANLNDAYLVEVDLSRADLSETLLIGADFFLANLSGANLTKAYLSEAGFRGADLTEAVLIEANLTEAVLSESNLAKANFSQGIFGGTILEIDLSVSVGLDTIKHRYSSIISIRTLQNSRGKIPIEFLRGCGLSDIDIEYAKLANPELTAQEVSEITHRIFELKDTRPIQISPLFISYSHANSNFVDKLETKLNDIGIRFWRDIHDATAGRLETQIDRAIRHNPTVLLILSEHSTSSDWVEHEARLARKLEKELGRDVLCPIALDDSWKTCHWPERIKEQIMEYNILDFSNWEDDDELDAMFKRLIDGLDMFYKK